MDNSGKSTVSLLLGIAIGGIFGVLFAPKSGKETRSDLQQYLKEAEGNFEKKKTEIKEAASKQMNRLKEQVSKTFQEGKEKMEKETKNPETGEEAEA